MGGEVEIGVPWNILGEMREACKLFEGSWGTKTSYSTLNMCQYYSMTAMEGWGHKNCSCNCEVGAKLFHTYKGPWTIFTISEHFNPPSHNCWQLRALLIFYNFINFNISISDTLNKYILSLSILSLRICNLQMNGY